MGASNVIAAFSLYAGRVPPLSMQCLAYMAVVSRDADTEPWFGQGHEALAVHAMGRREPVSDADLRAVRRAVAPLLKAGAIEADRKAAPRRNGPSTVRYRLNLVGRISSYDDPTDDPEPESERRTDSDQNVGRFPTERRTVSDRTQDEFRPTEEKEEKEEREEEEGVGFSTEVQTAREDHEPNPNPSPLKCLHGLPAAVRADGEPSCALCRRAIQHAS